MFCRQFPEGRRSRLGDCLRLAREPSQQLGRYPVGGDLLNERVERLATGGKGKAIGTLADKRP